MPTEQNLSRREREIMDILFALEEATVKQIQGEMNEPPTEMAIRRMLQILSEKGLLKRRKEGRAAVYAPKQSRKRAGTSALKKVLDTFFGGSLNEALSAHFSTKENISPDQLRELHELIRETRKQENKSKGRS